MCVFCMLRHMHVRAKHISRSTYIPIVWYSFMSFKAGSKHFWCYVTAISLCTTIHEYWGWMPMRIPFTLKIISQFFYNRKNNYDIQILNRLIVISWNTCVKPKSIVCMLFFFIYFSYESLGSLEILDFASWRLKIFASMSNLHVFIQQNLLFILHDEKEVLVFHTGSSGLNDDLVVARIWTIFQCVCHYTIVHDWCIMIPHEKW